MEAPQLINKCKREREFTVLKNKNDRNVFSFSILHSSRNFTVTVCHSSIADINHICSELFWETFIKTLRNKVRLICFPSVLYTTLTQLRQVSTCLSSDAACSPEVSPIQSMWKILKSNCDSSDFYCYTTLSTFAGRTSKSQNIFQMFWGRLARLQSSKGFFWDVSRGWSAKMDVKQQMNGVDYSFQFNSTIFFDPWSEVQNIDIIYPDIKYLWVIWFPKK